MSTPIVSVVIPAYNAERTIGATVRSALSQVSVEVEVIVVDDGSTDGTVCTVQAIDDSRLSVITQANQGVATARNAGIAQATASWVAFLDADDLWLPEKLERQLELAARHPEAFAIHAGATIVDDDLRIIRSRRCNSAEDTLLHYLRFQNLPAVSSSWVIRRETFSIVGGFDPTLPAIEDWDMSIRLAKFGRPHSVAEPLTLYRQHPGNRSRDLDIHVTAGLAILEKVFSAPDLPADIRARRREIYSRFYAMLSGGALRTNRWASCLFWACRSVVTHPGSLTYIAGFPARRLRHRYVPSQSRTEQ